MLEVMDFNSTCWPFIIQPDRFHRLLLFAFPHAQEITEQIQAEFAEISTLSRQIVIDDDKDDEAIIARADAVRAEAIHAIEEFLN